MQHYEVCPSDIWHVRKVEMKINVQAFDRYTVNLKSYIRIPYKLIFFKWAEFLKLTQLDTCSKRNRMSQKKLCILAII